MSRAILKEIVPLLRYTDVLHREGEQKTNMNATVSRQQLITALENCEAVLSLYGSWDVDLSLSKDAWKEGRAPLPTLTPELYSGLLEMRKKRSAALVESKTLIEKVRTPSKLYADTGHWDHFENLRTNLEEFISLSGGAEDRTMPSHSDLVSARRFDLVHAIRKHGGFPAVASRLGLKTKEAQAKAAVSSLTFDELVKYLQKLAKEVGNPNLFPERRLLGKKIEDAISFHGGTAKVSLAAGFKRYARRKNPLNRNSPHPI